MFKGFWDWLFPPIIPGQIWCAKCCSPWDNLREVEILDVQEGWVRYQFARTKCGTYDVTVGGFRMFYSLKKGS